MLVRPQGLALCRRLCSVMECSAGLRARHASSVPGGCAASEHVLAQLQDPSLVRGKAYIGGQWLEAADKAKLEVRLDRTRHIWPRLPCHWDLLRVAGVQPSHRRGDRHRPRVQGSRHQRGHSRRCRRGRGVGRAHWQGAISRAQKVGASTAAAALRMRPASCRQQEHSATCRAERRHRAARCALCTCGRCAPPADGTRRCAVPARTSLAS